MTRRVGGTEAMSGEAVGFDPDGASGTPIARTRDVAAAVLVYRRAGATLCVYGSAGRRLLREAVNRRR